MGRRPWEEVTSFLGDCRTSQAPESIDADTAARYIERQATGNDELLAGG